MVSLCSSISGSPLAAFSVSNLNTSSRIDKQNSFCILDLIRAWKDG